MTRPTVQIGHPSLTTLNDEITDFTSEKTKQVIEDLIDTMHDTGLIGMAAPQIGENFQVFITEPRQTDTRPADQADDLRIYINPKIVELSPDQSILYEGCGSIMNAQLFGPVKRPKVVTLEAYNESGQKIRFTADGILGRVIQHEYDHIIGVLFTEKITDYKQLIHADFYKEKIKHSPDHQQAAKITVKKFEYTRQ